jgi:hypothetical protein
VSNTTGQLQSSFSASPPLPTSATSLSTGAKAGIAVGAILGVFLLIGILFFVRKALAWKKAASTASKAEVEASGYAHRDSPPYQFQQQQDAAVYNYGRYEAGSNEINELHDAKAAKVSELPESQVSELSETTQMAELPSYSPLKGGNA